MPRPKSRSRARACTASDGSSKIGPGSTRFSRVTSTAAVSAYIAIGLPASRRDAVQALEQLHRPRPSVPLRRCAGRPCRPRRAWPAWPRPDLAVHVEVEQVAQVHRVGEPTTLAPEALLDPLQERPPAAWPARSRSARISSAAMTAWPPERESTARRLPAQRRQGQRLEVVDQGLGLRKRAMPAWRRAASTTWSSAARAAGVRRGDAVPAAAPMLDLCSRMGLSVRRASSMRRRPVADALQVHADDVGLGIVDEVLEQVVLVDVELVAHRDQLGHAEALAGQDVEDARAHPAALGDDRDAPRAARSGRGCRTGSARPRRRFMTPRPFGPMKRMP